MFESSAQSAPTLWERRKYQAMARIQRVALDLFDEFGYREVTVERVAAAAGVSPSSIYRYFGTKEMLVLYDEADPKILDVVRTAGGGKPFEVPTLVALARALVPTVAGALITDDAEQRLRRSLHYVRTIAEVREGQMRQMREMEEEFRVLFAERSGRDHNDLRVRLAAATAIWGGVAALDHWAATGFQARLRDVYREAVGSIIDAIEAIFR
jgi:AcrR family transcriptional regulator